MSANESTPRDELRHGLSALRPVLSGALIADLSRLAWAAVDAETCDHEAQIHDLLEEREELLTEIRRLRMGNHPAGRALWGVEARDWIALRDACEDRDAGHEGDVS